MDASLQLLFCFGFLFISSMILSSLKATRRRPRETLVPKPFAIGHDNGTGSTATGGEADRLHPEATAALISSSHLPTDGLPFMT